MEKFYINIQKLLVAFTICIALAHSAFAVNLVVSGITPIGANGTYVPSTSPATINGKNVWVHQSGGYYIYNDIYKVSGNPDAQYWNIDVDLLDQNPTDVLFFSNDNSNADSPTSVTSWSTGAGVGAGGMPNIVEETATPVPEIVVTGNSQNIADGSGAINLSFSNHTRFGSVNISSASVTRTYTITNIGAGTLNISSVAISGTNADQFSKTNPLSATLASSGSTTFTVTFDPSSSGIKNATVIINNDDSDEGTFDFAIGGYGYTPEDLVITGITGAASVANTEYIHQGVTNGFEYWKSANNYYIYNDGSFWDIDNDLSGVNSLFFSANNSTSPSVLDVTSWTLDTGTGTPVISTATAIPNINLTGNGTSITINDATPSFSDYTKFGSINFSSGSRTRTYTIENTGGAALTITGVTLGGADASDFSKTDPVLTTIPAFSNTTFTVTFDPSSSGTKSASISIASDDGDENPYIFSISGDAYFPNNLVVKDITTPAEANGTYIYQGIQGEFQFWKHQTLNYYIYNSTYSNEHWWYIDNDQSSTSDFDFLFAISSEVVAPVGLTGWTLGTGAAGSPSITYAGPEMDIKGNSLAIADGDATPTSMDFTDFGSVNRASGTISRSFVIYNTASIDLNLTGTPIVDISGTDKDDFTVTTQPGTPVAATTGTATFTVQFDPSGIGTRSATLSIANDDSDENPYNFAIQGTGLNTAPVAIAPTAPTAVNEDDTNIALDDDIQLTDVDGDAQTVTFTITGGSVTLGTTGITFGGGGNGSSSFTAQGTLAAINTALDAATFTPTHNLFGTNAGTIAFISNDGTDNSNNASVSFDITAVNDEPTLTATGTNPTFTEDGATSDLYSTVSVSAIESGQTIIQLGLTVSNVNDGSNEIMTIDGSDVALANGNSLTTATNGMDASVSVTGSTATIIISKLSGISSAAMQTLVDGMNYRNTSNTPNTSNRVVTLTSLKDDGGTANLGDDTAALSVTSTVTVVAANDDPAISGLPTDISVTEDLASDVDLSSATLSDADAGSNSITLTIATGSGTLAATSGGSVTIGGSGTGTITLVGSVSNIDTYLNTASNIQYTGALNAFGNNVTTLTLTANDGGNTGTGGGTNVSLGTVNIDISGVNDDPTATGLPSVLTEIEDTGGAIDLSGVNFNDPDIGSGNATLTISVVSGTIGLANPTSYSITATGNGTGTITLTGNITNITSYLDTPTNTIYTGSSNNNGTAADVLTIKINDNGNTGIGGGTDITLGTVNIDITAVNDPPVIGGVFGDTSSEVVAGTGARNITGLDDATVTNVDSPDYNGGFLTIAQTVGTANGSFGLDGTTATSGGDATIAAGETVSVGGNDLGIVHATNDGQGGNSLQIDFNSTNATNTNIQNLIRSLTYAAPSGLDARTFTLTLNDNDGTTNGGDEDASGNFGITVTPNPPVLGNIDGDNLSIPVGGTVGFIDVAGNATITDADSPDFNGGNFSITQNTGTANGNFAVDGTNVTSGGDDIITASEAISVGGTAIGTVDATNDGQAGNDLLITLNSNATPARVQSLLRNIQYSASSGSGDRTFTISVQDAASGSNPASGTADIAISVLPPEINIKQGATAIADAGSFDFGSKSVNSDTDITFTIENTGTGVLSITTPITLGGADAGQFSIQLQPASSVTASGSTTFIVRFTPTSVGIKNANISIANNDTDENPYDLNIQGNGTINPTITTTTALSVSSYSAILGGDITDDGGSAITERGIVYSTSDHTPTIGETGVTKIVIGAGMGSFNEPVGSLSASATYYVQAYAINGAGTTYGGIVNFTTSAPLIPATVVTTTATTFDSNSATLGGNITNDGGYFVFDRGVVYSATDQTPTIGEVDVKKENMDVGSGNFNKSIQSLLPGTTYYFQAYAWNNGGISYGGVQSFTTLKAPTVKTLEVDNITSVSATGHGSITDLGIPSPMAHGICWSTHQIPTIEDQKLDNGPALNTGEYSCMMTGLTANTVYYVRAFATNSSETIYGEEVTFSSGKLIPVITWGHPADIEHGTALSEVQLNATADVEGTFIYDPLPGTVLNIGDEQPLTLVFNPTDFEHYATTRDTIKINVTIGTGIDLKENPSITIYPNPTTDSFQVGGITDAATITVSDINGKLLFMKKAYEKEAVSVKALTSGFYIIRINSNNLTKEFKLIKK